MPIRVFTCTSATRLLVLAFHGALFQKYQTGWERNAMPELHENTRLTENQHALKCSGLCTLEFTHGLICMAVIYRVNNTLWSLSLQDFYWLRSPIPTFQGITWPCASVRYWFSYSLRAVHLSASQHRSVHFKSLGSYYSAASTWSTLHAYFMQSDTILHNQNAAPISSRPTFTELTHLCNLLIVTSVFKFLCGV